MANLIDNGLPQQPQRGQLNANRAWNQPPSPRGILELYMPRDDFVVYGMTSPGFSDLSCG
jgi:hypothetical protein